MCGTHSDSHLVTRATWKSTVGAVGLGWAPGLRSAFARSYFFAPTSQPNLMIIQPWWNSFNFSCKQNNRILDSVIESFNTHLGKAVRNTLNIPNSQWLTESGGNLHTADRDTSSRHTETLTGLQMWHYDISVTALRSSRCVHIPTKIACIPHWS